MDKRPTILVVDDDPEFRKTLSDIVRLQGYTPLAVAKGKTALNKVKEKRPAVVLIDLKLPDMDGLELVGKIKKRSPDTECIVLTGYAGLESAIEAVNLGAYGYLQKPYDVEQLVLTIRRAVEKRKAEEALRSSKAFIETVFSSVNDAISVIDTTNFRILAVNTAFINTFHMEEKDIIGKCCYEVTHHRAKPCEPPDKTCPLVETLKTGKHSSAEHIHYDKDGRETYVEVSTSPIRNEKGEIYQVVHIVRDITERKRAEEEITRRARQLALINEVGQKIAPILELPQLYQTVVEAVQEKFGYQNVAIFSVRDGEVALEAIAGPQAESMPSDYTQKIGEGMVGWVAQTGETLLANDVTKEPRFLPLEFLEIAAELDVPIRLHGKTIGVLLVDSDRPNAFTEADVTTLETIANQVAQAIENARLYEATQQELAERKRAEEALRHAALETLQAVSSLVEAKDPYTAGHSSRVTEIALKIAEEMGLGEDDLNILRIAGPLHDVGKVGVSGSVLNKPSRLTQAEWVMIQAHPVVSAQTAERVTAFKDAVPVIRHHHERWDGTGYPDGLKGEEIPLLARILAVADGFEAMTSERPYRRAMSVEEALAILKKGAGSQWDPEVVKTFLNLIKSPTQRKGERKR